jgi:tetratricopeptide (TPR) repeat protein
MRVARNLRSEVLAGTTHLALGGVLAAAGTFDAAAAELCHGIEIAESVGEQGLAMGCAIQLALVQLRRGDLPAAESLFTDSLRRAQELKGRRGMAVCMLALGLISRTRSDDAGAANLYQVALDLADEERNPRIVAECLTRLADVARDNGDVTKAEDLCVRAKEILDQVSAPDLRAEVLRQLGRCRSDRGDHRAAVTALREAAAEFAELGQPPGVLSCLIHLAWALPRAGEPEYAWRVMRRAARIASGQPVSPSTVVGLIMGGNEALARGDAAGAQDHFEDALAAAQKIRNRLLIADCSCRLAAAARRCADPAEAARRLETALAIARHQGDRMMALHVHCELGLVRSDDDKSAARVHYEASVNLANELGQDAVRTAAQLLMDRLDQAHCNNADPDLLDDALAVAADEFTELCWLRRLRAADGETAFDGQMMTYIGPSIDAVMHHLVPRLSGVSSVPTVVSPPARPGRIRNVG